MIKYASLALCLGLLPSKADPYRISEPNWVDPDTPLAHKTIQPLSPGDDRTYELIFSDEFEVDGRTFHDGHDPRWTAINKNDFTNNPLHYYSHDADTVHSQDGKLNIRLGIEPRDDLWALDENNTVIDEYKEFKSGMLQSWNKFCFTGGIVEFSAKMPGAYDIAGLWPALWMMGNLGRATYINSTEQMWPFSTNVCDDRTQNSQLINSCPPPANETLEQQMKRAGMPPGRGRGAPEVDLLEVMNMDKYFTNPILSSSLQVAPGVRWDQRPALGHVPNASNTWYTPELGDNVTQNLYFYGTVSFPFDKDAEIYRTDSLSANMVLNEDYYTDYHTFRVEWEPPIDDSGYGGYIQWYIDDQLVQAVYGDDLQTTSQTEIPSEPMYLVMNMAVSKDWGFPDAYFLNCPKKCWSCLDPECACALPKGYCDNLPTSFEIESVRVYQPTRPDDYATGRYARTCSPPNRPTAEFIQAHKDHYKLHEHDEPLLEIQVGGGNCTRDEDCGSTDEVQRGVCSMENEGSTGGSCVCKSTWTGPHCLAHYGMMETDSEWYVPEKPSNFSWKTVFGFLVVVVGAALLAHGVRTKLLERNHTSYEKLSVNACNPSSSNYLYKDESEDEVSPTPPSQSPLSYKSYQNGANV